VSEWTDLFSGETLHGWTARGPHEWHVAGGVRLRDDDPTLFTIQPGAGLMVNGERGVTEDIHTVAEHGSCELHLEFCVPKDSNSGVYLMGQYEIQVLDSWGTPDSELKFGSNGGIYARWIPETKTAYDGTAPRTNASRAPGEWQRLEVVFHAPRFDAAGDKVGNARFERVALNGRLIHEDVECTGPTRGAWSEDRDIPRGPLRLQGDHGPVAYRNIRIRHLP
jgi:hypothetical protein